MVPSGLTYFVEQMCSSSVSQCKIAHIGQTLMSLCKPRGPILPPLQLLLALKVHKQFGSREIVDVLHAAGFCVSYDEVSKFERCLSVTNFNSLDSDACAQLYVQVETIFIDYIGFKTSKKSLLCDYEIEIASCNSHMFQMYW